MQISKNLIRLTLDRVAERKHIARGLARTASRSRCYGLVCMASFSVGATLRPPRVSTQTSLMGLLDRDVRRKRAWQLEHCPYRSKPGTRSKKRKTKRTRPACPGPQ